MAQEANKEKQTSDSISDFFNSINGKYKKERATLKSKGLLSTSTQILVNDLTSHLIWLKESGRNADLFKMEEIIKMAKKEAFHDFYSGQASDEDSDDEYMDINNLHELLKNIKGTENIRTQIVEGKYDAKKDEFINMNVS